MSKGPYKQDSTNAIYNLLFCDDPDLFRSGKTAGVPPWTILLDPRADPAAVAAIAEDASAESRQRAIAYNWLRQHGEPVPAKILLGTIIERDDGYGLDVLATYADNAIRYINHTEKMSIFEGPPAAIAAQAENVTGRAQAIVDRIGPWTKPRLPAPQRGNVRLSFLVSDGLYFGEGPIAALERDGMAGPLLAEAGGLLQLIVEAVTNAPPR